MAEVDLLPRRSAQRIRRIRFAAAAVALSVGVLAGIERFYGPFVVRDRPSVLEREVGARSFDAPDPRDLPGGGSRQPDAAGDTGGQSKSEKESVEITADLEPRDLSEWLGVIASEAGLGVVIGQDVGGRPTARFPPQTGWRAKLDALAAAASFSYEVEDGLLKVRASPPEPPPVASFATEEASAAIVDAEPAVPEPDPASLATHRLRNARAKDLARVVEESLGGRGLVATADEASNTLVVSGNEPLVLEALSLTDALDVPRRKFLLEARIVEMLSAARSELGIQWRLDSGDFGAGVNFPADEAGGEGGDGSEITVATTGTASLRARLSALEASGRVRVIARPRVLVVEGRTALIESVRILRVRLPDSTAVIADADEVVAPERARAVESFPVGISLRVEPSLLGGGDVALRIVAKSSTLGEPLPPDNIPEEFSRLVEADVIVADGRTAVLGGLSRVGRSRNDAGVPFLRDLPLVGALFGRRGHERDTEELLVLVTPRLLPGNAE